MTSRALVLLLIAIVRRCPDDDEAAAAVLTFLCERGFWFSRQVEDANGITVEHVLRKGRQQKRRLFQALLSFDAEMHDATAQPRS